LDLLVEGALIVELKAVEHLLPIHHAQLLTYLKLRGSTLGLLINFNVPHLKDGIQRMVLNHPSSPLRAPSRLDTATGLGAEPQRTPRDAKEDAWDTVSRTVSAGGIRHLLPFAPLRGDQNPENAG
jgi:hypothetical protein